MWTVNLFLFGDMSVYLQEAHPKRRAAQSFSNCGLKITYIVWEWTSSLSGSVNRRINREWQRFSLSNMQRKKGSKRIEMIIKMVNEFKLTVVHFARSNPMQICACAWIYCWTKKLWKIRTGPPGLRAAGQPGRWVFWPWGRRGPWAAGRWAAGLLLAKPSQSGKYFEWIILRCVNGGVIVGTTIWKGFYRSLSGEAAF